MWALSSLFGQSKSTKLFAKSYFTTNSNELEMLHASGRKIHFGVQSTQCFPEHALNL